MGSVPHTSAHWPGHVALIAGLYEDGRKTQWSLTLFSTSPHTLGRGAVQTSCPCLLKVPVEGEWRRLCRTLNGRTLLTSKLEGVMIAYLQAVFLMLTTAEQWTTGGQAEQCHTPWRKGVWSTSE